MALHIPDIRAIRLFVPFVIPSADFITNFTNGRMTRILTGYFLASPKELSHHMVLIAPLARGLYGMGSDLSSMERGELCRDRCTGLLLAEYMQDRGAARPNAKTLCTGSVLKSGVW